MIPNPEKTITIDFPIEEVRSAVKGLPRYFLGKYQMHQENDVFGQYTLSALELLSLGIFMDIGLHSVSETRTEVSMEVRRKIGAFDQAFEVSNANRHLVDVMNALTHLIQHGREPEKYPLPQPPSAQEKKKESNTNLIIVGVFVVVVLIVYFINHRG